MQYLDKINGSLYNVSTDLLTSEVGALVGGVARPVGPGAAGGTGFVFEGDDGEERKD